MRVLMLAIRYDVDDWATNFIPNWVTKLAAYVNALDVLALEMGNVGDLPSNVRVFSMGKTANTNRLQVLGGFYRHAAKLIPQCDVVFVHMIPRYALLAAPLALPLNKPITLWYTHRNPSNDLKRALPLVKQVVTAVESSFPLKTDKLKVLGHGIDTDFFQMGHIPSKETYIVHVARMQRIKRQDVLLYALPHLPDAHAVLIGDVPLGEDRAYGFDLQAMVNDDLKIRERVTFTGGQKADGVRDWYQKAAVAVNLSPPGLFDKAPLESMAAGVPTIVTNPAFDPLLGEWRDLLRISDPPKTQELAAHIDDILSLSHSERAEMGRTLRENVIQHHSLDSLIKRLADVLASSR